MELFAEEHQDKYYEDNCGTGFFNVVSEPVCDGTKSEAILLVEVYHRESNVDYDHLEYRIVSNILDGIYGHALSDNIKLATYELSLCEEEYKNAITNTSMITVEQYPLSLSKMHLIRNINNLPALSIAA
ncbi:hypothetical protein [Photobacterium leiognathi]|uniref:hypothetical protein n=1 Tax=Photobacterium leiognathi TaxID=553611 RepID=UPI002980BA20|nr:hypothetical protein [Photobacterium leiognathi]